MVGPGANTESSVTPPPWPRAIALAWGIALALLFAFLLGPGQELQWDNGAHNLPLTFEAARQWLEGGLPAWNPFLWSGSPLLADPQATAFYPPTMGIHALMQERPLLSMRVIAAVHVAIAATGAALVARSLGLSVFAGLLAATTFALNPWALRNLLGFANIYAAAAWLPWQLLALHHLMRAARPSRWLALAALSTALGWLAGYPQMWIFAGIFACGFCLGTIPPARLLGRLWLAPLAYLLGLGLSAFQVLPFVSLWQTSQRTDAVPLLSQPFWPLSELPGILIPGLVTGLHLVEPWLSVPSFLNLPYLGFLAVALALVSVFHRDRLRWWLALLGILGLLLAMGPQGGLSQLVQSTPILGLFRKPHLYFVWVTMSVALLGAFGLDDVLYRRRRWHRFALLGIGILAILGFLNHETAHPFALSGPLRAPLLIGIAVAGTLGLIGLTAKNRAGLAGVVVVASALLGFVLEASGLRDPATSALARFARAPEIASWTVLPSSEPTAPWRRSDGSRTHWGLSLVDFFRRPNDLRGAAADLWRIETSSGYSALVDPQYIEAIGYYVTGNLKNLRVLEPPNAVLDILSTPYVLVDNSPKRQRQAERNKKVVWKPLTDDLAVVLRPEALPRARSVRGILAVPSRHEAIQRTRTAGRKPRQLAWVDTEDGAPATLRAGERAPCRIAPGPSRPGFIELEADCSGEGFLVLSERYDPGWTARIDGRSAPLYRAYGLVLGMDVPAGRSTVRLQYRAVHLDLGLGIAATLALILMGLALRPDPARSKTNHPRIKSTSG